MYYNGNYINILLRDDMDGIKGCLKSNSDGSYSIFINSRMGLLQQKKTLYHELKHIERNDFEKHDIQQIEYDAHFN